MQKTLSVRGIHGIKILNSKGDIHKVQTVKIVPLDTE